MTNEILYVVYLQDTNGSCRIIGDLDITKEEAESRINRILAGQNKAHKVDYFMAGYTTETKHATLTGLGINR